MPGHSRDHIKGRNSDTENVKANVVFQMRNVRKGNPLGLWNDPRLKPYSQQPRPGSNHSIHPQRVDQENVARV